MKKHKVMQLDMNEDNIRCYETYERNIFEGRVTSSVLNELSVIDSSIDSELIFQENRIRDGNIQYVTIYDNDKITDNLFENTLFREAYIDGAKLRNNRFINCNFHHCRFHNIELSGGEYRDCEFKSCEFVDSTIDTEVYGTHFSHCKFMRVKFKGSVLYNGFVMCEFIEIPQLLTLDIKENSFCTCEGSLAFFVDMVRLDNSVQYKVRANPFSTGEYSFRIIKD